jgi:ubiquinone/menaquinone biosynthesis C-methylase UbiE
LALVRERGWAGRVVGLDITRAMLDGASGEVERAGAGERIRLVCGSGMQLPFGDGVFDIAICALATHHMNVPELLREMRRVLQPGGQLLVADVALASFWRTPVGALALRVLTWWYTLREEPTRAAAEKDTPANMLTPDRWREEIALAGFSVTNATVVRARRRLYPPGLIVAARASF